MKQAHHSFIDQSNSESNHIRINFKDMLQVNSGLVEWCLIRQYDLVVIQLKSILLEYSQVNVIVIGYKDPDISKRFFSSKNVDLGLLN